MLSESLYRYYGEIPNYSGGTITVMPCGVVTFGAGDVDPSWDNYVKFIGSHDSDLAAELEALDNDDSAQEDDQDPSIAKKIAKDVANETVDEAAEEITEEAIDAVEKVIVITGALEPTGSPASKIILVKSFCPRYYESDSDTDDNVATGGDDSRPRAADPVPPEYMFIDDVSNPDGAINPDAEFDITTIT